MNVARSLERRLERLLEGVFGRVFSGRLHASEIAARIAREADLARFDHPSGPATPNSFTLTFNPKDIEDRGEELAGSLEESFEDYVVESGLRLVGPPKVTIHIDENVVSGQFLCHLEVMPGDERPWARLVSQDESLVLKANRSIVGRSADADVTTRADDVSREQALIWRSEGSTWIRDLGSANGTFVDDTRVGSEAVRLATGSNVRFSTRSFRFIQDANA